MHLAVKIAMPMLAALLGAWMLFDGIHAVRTGEYVVPRSGEHAGRLGPWADLVRAVGVEPHSTAMHALFVLLGLLWLAFAAAAGMRPGLEALRIPGIALAVATLWYAPIGSVLALLELSMLLFLFRAGPG